RFDAGPAESRARAVEQDGPILFADAGGGSRDIYLQHVGDDPRAGWLAFDARKPGASRACTLEWAAGADRFVDPCDGTPGPPDGGGLIHYEVEVTEDGNVIVDFHPDDE